MKRNLILNMPPETIEKFFKTMDRYFEEIHNHILFRDYSERAMDYLALTERVRDCFNHFKDLITDRD